jgi:hypothetical protein
MRKKKGGGRHLEGIVELLQVHILNDRRNASGEAVKIPPNDVPTLAIVAMFGPEYLVARKAGGLESNWVGSQGEEGKGGGGWGRGKRERRVMAKESEKGAQGTEKRRREMKAHARTTFECE